MRLLLVRLAGIASGLMMMIPHLWPSLAWLQAVALLPILCAAGWPKAPRRDLFAAGAYMGLVYVLPQAVALLMPPQITLILAVEFTALLTVFVVLAAWLLRGPAPGGALVVGALLVLLDWLNFTLVPIWGTAQSFARPWSSYPSLIGFVSFTGTTGICFVLAAGQALLVSLLLCSGRRLRILAALVVLVLICVGADLVAAWRRPRGRIKVAAVGWAWAHRAQCQSLYERGGFDAVFGEPARQAAAGGAKLVVSPEAGFRWSRGDRDRWLGRFAAISRRHGIFLAVGYVRVDGDDVTNRLFFMDPTGEVVGEYVKTHLTPFEGHFRRGDGSLIITDMPGARLGGMICQDDNFTDLSRGHGREGVTLMAVPTLDWRAVKGAHLQASIHRAIESRYAVVRAAMNGISAIISPTGRVLARRDHFEQGPGVIVAEVPIYGGCTPFSILGHWPVAAGLLFLLVHAARRLLRNGSRRRNGGR